MGQAESPRAHQRTARVKLLVLFPENECAQPPDEPRTIEMCPSGPRPRGHDAASHFLLKRQPERGPGFSLRRTPPSHMPRPTAHRSLPLICETY